VQKPLPDWQIVLIGFDMLAYVRRVVAAGVPRKQAEAQADAMKEAFVHNVEALPRFLTT
jgi:hypothetical protein